jgi:hypothetical protein
VPQTLEGVVSELGGCSAAHVHGCAGLAIHGGAGEVHGGAACQEASPNALDVGNPSRGVADDGWRGEVGKVLKCGVAGK